jgi:three-Cys-motif partner protein
MTTNEFADEDGLPLDEVGVWAKEKHERLLRYIDISRAARRKLVEGSGGATYIDFFCGAGRAAIHETGEIIDGSPLIAFKCARAGGVPFTEIHIADFDEKKVSSAASRITKVGGSAKSYVGQAARTAGQIVEHLNPYGLHFAFLDPFNLDDLPFSVIETLSQLKRVDLLIHVSAQDLQRNWTPIQNRKTVRWITLPQDGETQLISSKHNRLHVLPTLHIGHRKWNNSGCHLRGVLNWSQDQRKINDYIG